MGTTHLGAPGGGRALVGCAHPGAPLRWFLAPEINIYCIKISPKVSFESESFYFCIKNNIMVVLLKTSSVRVSFIQIMQIRVQNKRESVRKSRYVGDVSVELGCCNASPRFRVHSYALL